MALFSDVKIDFFVNTKQALKSIAEFKKNVSKSFNDVKNSLLGQVGGLATAYFGAKALKGVYDDTMKLVNLSEKWQLPVEQISRFTNTLAMFGGGTDEAISNLESLEQAITDLKTTGGGALKSVANQIGLNLYNADGSIKNSLTLLEDLRGKFKTLNKDGQIKVAQELGLASPATLRLLRASDEEYKKLTKDANKFGVVNAKTAQNMIKFQRTITKLKQSFKSLAGTIIEKLQPILDKVADGMEWLANQSDDVKMAIIGIGAGIPVLNGVLGVLKGMLLPLKVVKTGFKTISSLSFANLGEIAIIADSISVLSDFFGKRKEGQSFTGKVRETNENYKKNWDWSKDWWRVGKMASIAGAWIGDKFGDALTPISNNPNISDIKKQEMIWQIGQMAGKNTNTNTTNRNINISNVNINAKDGTDAGQKFLNVLNTQNATGVLY